MKIKPGIFLVFALFSLFVFVTNTGCTSTPNVVGSYTHITTSSDTYTITINADGTYTDDSYSQGKSGTWTVDGNNLDLNPSTLSWQPDTTCGNPQCPPKQVWVPSGNIMPYKIGTNQITDEHGIVWVKS